MIKYIIALLLLASQCCAGVGIGVTPWPGPGQNIPAGAATTYYLGYLDEVETTSTPSGTPNSSTTITADNGTRLRKITIPAGATVKTIWYRFGSGVTCNGGNPVKVSIFSYVSDTAGGDLLAESTITPSANTWVESGILSGSQTYFSSNTDVFVGITFLCTTGSDFTITRNSSGTDYFYKTSVYSSTNLGAGVSSAAFGFASVLEYER